MQAIRRKFKMSNKVCVEVFEIIFDNEQAVYREGDTVSGNVKLVLTEEIKLKAFVLELCGIAVVHWNGENKEEADLDEKVKGDCSSELYFSRKIMLLEKDGCFLEKDPVLANGAHLCSFEAKLPSDLPSSFEGQYGQVRYLARCYIERPRKTNITTKRAFTVLSGLDLNFIPEAAARIELCKYRDVGGICCTAGSVTADWTVERSGFVPGEDIHISGAVQNDSSELITASKAVLYMVVEYKTKKRKRCERHVVAAVEKGATPSADVTVWNDSIHIPPVPPTGLSRCRLINVNYELQFTASFEGKYSPISFTKELYIGTVPVSRHEMKSCIAGMFNQPYLDSTEQLNDNPPINPAMKGSNVSLTQIVAAAAINEKPMAPTAPTLATLERHLGAAAPPPAPLVPSPPVERPPPYAPGHTPVVTTAPRTPSTNAPKTELYPSLAASWFGPVSIREPDDTESVRGELTYSPIYTYYNSS